MATRPGGTPGGQGVPIPAQYVAHQNPGESMDDYDDRRQTLLAQYYTERLKADPNFQLPGNYHATADQGVVPTEPSFLMRHPWLIPLIGVGVGLTAGAASGAFAGGGAADAVVPGVVGGTEAEAAGIIPGALASTGGTAATGAAVGAGAETGGLYAAGTGPGLVPGAGITPSVTDSILGAANRVAPVINGIAQQAQNGRQAEADATQAQDRNANTRYANSIQAANVNLGAADRRASASVHGDILANAQPLRLTGGTQMVGNTPVPQTSGGLSPSIFSDNTRQLGKTISSQQLTDQQANGGKAVLPQDPLTPLPNANGTGSKILTAAGYIAPLLGAINYGRGR